MGMANIQKGLRKLHKILKSKVQSKWDLPWGDGAYPACQLLYTGDGTFFIVYEAGIRGALFPRLAWKVPGSVKGHEDAIQACIQMEEASPNTIVALRDMRQVAECESFDVRALQPLTAPTGKGDVHPYIDYLRFRDRAVQAFLQGDVVEAVRLRDQADVLRKKADGV